MNKIEVKDFLSKAKYIPIIDVRSPREYEVGHIPGAINIPLFTNEERAEIGTLYKRKGKEIAVLKGLDIIGPKMSTLAKQANKIAKNKELLVHCWRGGMRSESMAWLFEKINIKCTVLIGGYKAYRNYLLQQVGIINKMIVLTGFTGSGKTLILSELQKQNQQIIDLEAIASHRGSSFGNIGQLPQPSTQQFQNNLFQQVFSLNTDEPIWVEGESKFIGKVFLPDGFWDTMQQSATVEIEIPDKERIKRLVEDYANLDANEMKQAIKRLEKRLGGQRTKEIIDAYLEKNYEKVAELLLIYYDKGYKISAGRNFQIRKKIKLPDGNAKKNAIILIDQLASILNTKNSKANN